MFDEFYGVGGVDVVEYVDVGCGECVLYYCCCDGFVNVFDWDVFFVVFWLFGSLDVVEYVCL